MKEAIRLRLMSIKAGGGFEDKSWQLLPVTAGVSPFVFPHIAYHFLMRVAIGIHVYSLSAHIAIIPDLVVLLSLAVAFA